MRMLLIPLALGQSLVLAQLLTPSEETQETVASQADNNKNARKTNLSREELEKVRLF